MTVAQLTNMVAMCRHAGIGIWCPSWTPEALAACRQRQQFIRALGVRVEGNHAFCSDGVYTL